MMLMIPTVIVTVMLMIMMLISVIVKILMRARLIAPCHNMPRSTMSCPAL